MTSQTLAAHNPEARKAIEKVVVVRKFEVTLDSEVTPFYYLTVICLNKLFPFSFIAPSKLNLKVTYITKNTSVSYILSV